MIRTGFRHIYLNTVTPDQLAAAKARIASAERDLGRLSDGQRRDLLKDNMPWDGDVCDAAVTAVAATEARAVILPGCTEVFTDNDVAYSLWREKLTGHFILQRYMDGATVYLQGDDASQCQREVDRLSGLHRFEAQVQGFRLWADAFSELLDADKAQQLEDLKARSL